MVRRRPDNSQSSLGDGAARRLPLIARAADSGSACSGNGLLAAHKGDFRPDPNQVLPPLKTSSKAHKADTANWPTILSLSFLGSIIIILMIQGYQSQAAVGLSAEQFGSSAALTTQLQQSLSNMKQAASRDADRAERLKAAKTDLQDQVSLLRQQLEEQRKLEVLSAQSHEELHSSLLLQLRDERRELVGMRQQQASTSAELQKEKLANKKCSPPADDRHAYSAVQSREPNNDATAANWQLTAPDDVGAAALYVIPVLAVVRLLFVLRESNRTLKGCEYVIT